MGDLLWFQIKLGLDGLKDAILSPFSLAAGVIGIVFQRDDPARLFRHVLKAGERFDRWVNLYGAAGPQDANNAQLAEAQLANGKSGDPTTIDGVTARIEQAMIGLSQENPAAARARASLDKGIDVISRPPQKPPTQ